VNALPPQPAESCVRRALVLAAGEGTRLRPLTLDRPKPMLPIAGRSLLERTIEWLRSAGICSIAINLHYFPQAITEQLGDGSRLGVQLTYSYEETMLGTAGAVRRLARYFAGEPFVVVYGDVLTDLDLRRLVREHLGHLSADKQTAVTMSLYHVDNPCEVGLVDLQSGGRITRFVEKPKPHEVFTDLASAGVLVAQPDIIEHIPAETFYDFGRDLFGTLLRAGRSIYGSVIPDGTYLLDIGTPEKYARAQADWAGR
jgi:NDP-sugar pyrophosphorylase family protein